ncbi:MAG: hypothetical protein PHO37_14125 [Kiritimatiellae bacterium]|nr:hypothetical protein [Kiritimatiellia bacterium]
MRTNASCSGLTMIELVSALTLFILIMGALTMALNKATALWSTSHTSQPEQEQANLILNLMADDLRLAVTDNGTLPGSTNEPPPTFLCDTTTNQAAGVTVILQFIKHRTKQSTFDATLDDPPALDAVFYTFFQDQESAGLFRYVIPLRYSDLNHPEHIGKLLEDLRPQVENLAEPPASWEYSLLSDKLAPPLIVVGIPSSYVRKNKFNPVTAPADARLALQAVPEYNQVATAVLPDYIDISLRIFSDMEWDKYNRLAHSSMDDEAFRSAQAHLGIFASRRITFKTMRGTRLP